MHILLIYTTYDTSAMSHHSTPADTQSTESLSQGQAELMNLASNVAAQAAKAVVETSQFGRPESEYQPEPSGDRLRLAQPQQARSQQAARSRTQQPARQQSQQSHQTSSPSFSQQAASPQFSAAQQQQARAESHQQYSPAVDVIERNDEVLVYADLPGVDEDSIDIEASDSTLSLSAERIDSQDDDQQSNPVLTERGKVMQRQIQLPAQCNVDDASASWDKGVAIITLPKDESESTKRIGVE